MTDIFRSVYEAVYKMYLVQTPRLKRKLINKTCNASSGSCFDHLNFVCNTNNTIGDNCRNRGRLPRRYLLSSSAYPRRLLDKASPKMTSHDFHKTYTSKKVIFLNKIAI